MFYIIGNWRLFKKMGYKGYYSLIPIYNYYCLVEAIYGKGWFLFLPLIICMGGSVLSTLLLAFARVIYVGRYTSFKAFMYGLLNGVSGLVMLAAIVVVIILVIKFLIKFTHAFSKKGWWTLGTIFFFPIFMMVYAYSDLKFKDRPYPNYDDYDAVDGFFEFFRNQGKKIEKEETVEE